MGAACLVTSIGRDVSLDVAAAAAAAASLVAVVGMLLGTVPAEAFTVVEVGAAVDSLSAGSESGSEGLCCR